VTTAALAKSYLAKARARLTILKPLQDAQDYSDVVREAQEIVELCLKGMLRWVGVEPPKWHDVGPLLTKHRKKLSKVNAETIERLAEISARLRKEREIAFYGELDFIPSEEYLEEDGLTAMQDARFVFGVAETVIG
jgi:hypothetical protein